MSYTQSTGPPPLISAHVTQYEPLSTFTGSSLLLPPFSTLNFGASASSIPTRIRPFLIDVRSTPTTVDHHPFQAAIQLNPGVQKFNYLKETLQELLQEFPSLTKTTSMQLQIFEIRLGTTKMCILQMASCSQQMFHHNRRPQIVRPVTRVSLDLDDAKPLTPAHLIASHLST